MNGPTTGTQVDFQGIKNLLSFHGVVGVVREPPMRDSILTICVFVCRTRPAFHLKHSLKKRVTRPAIISCRVPVFSLLVFY